MSLVPYAVFGPGALYLTNTQVANATPINIGKVQEFSYDETGETKELYGEDQYPLVIARGTIKATGKAKAALVSGIALNAAFWGLTFSSGQLQMARNVAGAIPGTPYQITPTVPGSGTFDTDLGVVYTSGANAGLPLVKVASSPTTGQYAESAGEYTFAAADTTITVAMTFAYTTTGAGQTMTVTNQAIGNTPTFQLDYVSVLYGLSYYVRFYQAVSNKLSRAHKLTDFMMPEIDFGFFANSIGNVYEMSYAQAN